LAFPGKNALPGVFDKSDGLSLANLRCRQGRNDGWARGAQFPGPLIAVGAPNDCESPEMSQQCHKYFLQ